jgi:5-methylcytosine-specific restriction endonuclease McrA
VSKGWEGGSTRAWRKARALVLHRDGHTCQIGLTGCTKRATHADHIVPVSQGGIRRQTEADAPFTEPHRP